MSNYPFIQVQHLSPTHYRARIKRWDPRWWLFVWSVAGVVFSTLGASRFSWRALRAYLRSVLAIPDECSGTYAYAS